MSEEIKIHNKTCFTCFEPFVTDNPMQDSCDKCLKLVVPLTEILEKKPICRFKKTCRICSRSFISLNREAKICEDCLNYIEAQAKLEVQAKIQVEVKRD